MPDIRIHRDHSLGLAKARKVAWQWAETAEQKFDMECTVIEGETSDTVEFTRSGVNGTLVDFFDIPAWSTALIKALAHPEQFQTLRQAARQTAIDRYDQQLLLPKMVNFVERHGPKR